MEAGKNFNFETGESFNHSQNYSAQYGGEFPLTEAELPCSIGTATIFLLSA